MKVFAPTVVLALLLSGCAGNWLVFTAASHHANRERSYKESNPGVGVEIPIGEDMRAIAGGYRNSHDRESLYAGGLWAPIKYRGFSLGVGAVVASGYEVRGWGINLMPAAPSVIGLQLKKKF